MGRTKRFRTIAMLAGLALALTVPGPAGATTPPRETAPDPAGPMPAAAPAGDYTLTLITGDRVTLTSLPDGKVTVDIEPAARAGGGFSYEWVERGEDYYVLPEDVLPYLDDVLDEELFNVTGLVRAGYHDAGTGGLPVIITYPDGDAPGTHPADGAAAGLAGANTLPSVGGVAAGLAPAAAADWWRHVTATGALAGVEKVWLDRPVTAALEDSVPMTGAPALWDAGFDGTGTTIAVLDTGIQLGNSELIGKLVAQQNFTDELGRGDGHGHGTHVASIAAGTGAASDGLRTGTAPGADLVNAKVLNRFGSGQTSWIIQAMEWVSQDLGVEVANLSLGGPVTDGTDPLSVALDQLTAQTDTLFVVAAGNDGEDGEGGVNSPGSADHALTVGAVDKAGQLADFSSRGPRFWDSAIKPDLTAPGVGIAAARASGTSMGDPIDDSYTRASGTSMATPHVAGAAAILRQQHPEWSWGQVTAALVGTAAPASGRTIYEQGGGLVDVPAAADTTVLADAATLDLGYFRYPHDSHPPVTADLTYTNLGEAPITLKLGLDVRTGDGVTPAPGMLELSHELVEVDPAGSVTVTVSLDPRLGARGRYGGYLEASYEGGAIRTPVGFHKDEEMVELTIQGIDTEGDPAAGNLTVMDVEDARRLSESVRYDQDGLVRMRVPPGVYAVYGAANTLPAGEVFATVQTAVAAPELVLTEDTTVVFDARLASEIEVTAPAHEVAPALAVDLSMVRLPEAGFGHIRGIASYLPDRSYRALPTTTPVTVGFFEFNSRWQLADPTVPDGGPVLYDLVFPEEGAIPAAPAYEVHPEQLGRSDESYHLQVPDDPVQQVEEFRHWWRPWQNISSAFNQPAPSPGLRTEYLSPDDTMWSRKLTFSAPGTGGVASMTSTRQPYQPGEHRTRSWMRQPVTPSMEEQTPWWNSHQRQQRVGDTLQLRIAEYGDAEPGHFGWYVDPAVDHAAFQLYRDGVLVADQVRPRGEFPLPADPARLRLELAVGRTASWWTMSTGTRTVWELDTARPPAGTTEVLPLLLVDYDLALDLLNRLPAGPGQTVGVQLRHQAGAATAPIDEARLWISYDDGQTWQERPGTAHGDGAFSFPLPNAAPIGAEFASLRFEATDADGNRIEQEVIRAWGLTATN